MTPREIVGAIANEAGIEGRYIGRIDIRVNYSTVDLPAGMPKEVLQHLKRVYVCGQALRITLQSTDSHDQRPPRHFKARNEGQTERGRSTGSKHASQLDHQDRSNTNSGEHRSTGRSITRERSRKNS